MATLTQYVLKQKGNIISANIKRKRVLRWGLYFSTVITWVALLRLICNRVNINLLMKTMRQSQITRLGSYCTVKPCKGKARRGPSVHSENKVKTHAFRNA